MKKFKMFASAFTVLAVVGGALAFTTKPISAGDVFCVPTTVTPDQNHSCASQQALNGDAQTYNFVSSGGSLTSPCASLSGTVTYVDDGSSCKTPISGTEYVLTSDE